jgi:gliding motility-associated-like protein
MRYIALIVLVFTVSKATSQFLQNPSFEGISGVSVSPPSWNACGDFSTPDTQPINSSPGWNFTKKALDGNTYLGLVMRGSGGFDNDNLTEAAGTKLLLPIKKNSCYVFSIYLSTFLGARYDLGFGDFLVYNNPGRLLVWAGSTQCRQQEIIWTSPIIFSEEWIKFTFQYSNATDKNFEYLILQATYADPSQKKYGNILIDNFRIEEDKISLGDNKVICEGVETTLTIPENSSSVIWSNGSTQPSISISKKGIYWAKISKGRCTVIDTLEAESVKFLDRSINIDTSLCIGDKLNVDVSTPFGSYLWSNGSVKPQITINQSGRYEVLITNSCNTIIGLVNVSYRDRCCQIYAPNVFSPNDDGINDFFEISTKSSITNYEMQIFNRWGGLVYKSDNIKNFWNGKENGVEVSAGVYYWVSYIKCSHVAETLQNKFQGTVTVMR